MNGTEEQEIVPTPPPQQQPGATPPKEPEQPPAGTPQLSADMLADAMVKAYRTAVPAAPMTPPPAARDWMDGLTPQQREGLQNQFLTDPLGAARFVSDQSANYARNQVMAEAAPLVASQARMIVNEYKRDKIASSPHGKAVADIFEAGLNGVDLRPLVNMGQAQQIHEMDMRWNSAFGQYAQRNPGQLAAKPEPILTATPAGGGAAPAARKFNQDPAMVRLAQVYNFTPEQIKEIEAEM